MLVRGMRRQEQTSPRMNTDDTDLQIQNRSMNSFFIRVNQCYQCLSVVRFGVFVQSQQGRHFRKDSRSFV